MFQKEDWTLFRSIPGLCQRAGVPDHRLRGLVVKELVDNALDAAENCFVDELDGGGFYVEDTGPGIPGEPEEIAALFSVSRPMTSSKLLRLPSRGALGNGLRVVSGAVLASGGELHVQTCGRRLQLIPKDSGKTDVKILSEGMTTTGTRIEVRLGDGIPDDDDHLYWGRLACQMANEREGYKGKTSAFWYDSDSFFELCNAAGDRTVRDLMESFDGFSGRKAGNIAAPYLGRTATSLSREEAESLLVNARQMSKEVKPSRLGALGRDAFRDYSYAKKEEIFEIRAGRGKLAARVPYVVEAWAIFDEEDSLEVFVNRTPITGDVRLNRQQNKTEIGFFGCGLCHSVKVGRKPLSLFLNITAPHIPLVSEGKEPDFTRFLDAIFETIVKVARGASRNAPKTSGRPSQKSVVLQNLDAAIDKASGGRQYRYSLRQLFYAIRPYILEILGIEPRYGNFEKIITEIEEMRGHDLPKIYRDNRGTLYHPHERRSIPLGTLTVEEYERPTWTFNKILYIEKEGFFSILQDTQWPERNDCALLTSKGYATRAARDLIDFLGDTDEEIIFFCVHDADAYGTTIYKSLQEATKARPERRVKIINLGLEPEEALNMGLPPERLDENKRGRPVADYVPAKWREWLQDYRVELNAMTTPQFLEWLDSKVDEYGNGKLIPPSDVLRDELEEVTRKELRDQIEEDVLKEAMVDEQVEEALQALRPQITTLNGRLTKQVRLSLKETPEDSWRAPISRMASELIKSE